jgi:hypothetical protein
VASLGVAGAPQSTPDQPAPLCGLPREPRYVLAGYSTKVAFDADNVAIQQVAVYQHPDAPVVLADSRSDSSRCYPADVGAETIDNHSEFTLPTYPGVADEFGYCDRFTFKSDNSVAYICHALLTHSNGYVIVDVSEKSPTLDGSRSKVLLLNPFAAGLLAKLPAT